MGRKDKTHKSICNGEKDLKQIDTVGAKTTGKKKKKHEKMEDHVSEDSGQDVKNTDGTELKEKKTKKRDNAEEQVAGTTDLAVCAANGVKTDDFAPVKKGKKKHKKDKGREIQATDCHEMNDERREENLETTKEPVERSEDAKKAKKSKKRKRENELLPVECDHASGNSADVPSKKKKKSKEKHLNKSVPDSKESAEVDCELKELKNAKKKRKQQKIEAEAENAETLKCDEAVEGNGGSGESKKKRKKDKLKDITPCENAEGESKKLRKEETEDTGTKTEATDKNKEAAFTVGQWGTAEFENAERQNKFLRLLGGMKNKNKSDGASTEKNEKKGLFGGLAALAAKTGNTAMTNSEQHKWQTNMEGQFNKALMYKGQKGGGLGFEKPPGEGKKFHIDIQKSSSIKFDD